MHKVQSCVISAHHEHDDLRGHRADRAHHARIAPSAATASRSSMPRELAACVERANLDPGGARDRARRQRQGLLRRLRSRRERRGSACGATASERRAAAARRSIRWCSRAQPRSRQRVGSDDRLRDDEPQRARLHEPVPRRQAGRVQGARLLRRRRHRHGAVLRPARDRGRREDRLPAGARLGRADDGGVGASHRHREGEAPALHRRLPLGHGGGGVGPRDRVRAARPSSTSASRRCSSASRACRSTSS